MILPPPTNDDAAGVNSAIESDNGTISQRFDALGKAIRAGVDSESAADKLGLKGLKFTGDKPVSLRPPDG